MASRHATSQDESSFDLSQEIHVERRRITILFADHSAFTTLAESIAPEELRALMPACFDRLVPVVERYGGCIDKFIGDELMALFGALHSPRERSGVDPPRNRSRGVSRLLQRDRPSTSIPRTGAAVGSESDGQGRPAVPTVISRSNLQREVVVE